MVSDQDTQDLAKEQSQAMASAPPPLRSAWSPTQKLVRLAWGTAGRLAWILLPAARPSLLRLFGGRVGRRCSIAGSVEIVIPWNIRMGDDCHVAEHAILYSLGPITLGDRVRIDTRAHLCAGSHDMRDTRFPLTRPPISIGDDAFIGVDAFIAPGVAIGDGCIVEPRASVYGNAKAGAHLQGNPAKAMS